MPVPSTMTVDYSFCEKTGGCNTDEQALHQETAQERRQDRPIHLWADHRGFPERDIQLMVGGVQDDSLL